MSHRRSVRILTLLLAAIQFAMPAAVSIADGAFSKLVSDPGAHVEAAGDTQCTPPHGADCVGCRYLSGTGATAPENAPAFASGASDPARALVPVMRGTAPQTFTQSRAPPTV